MDNLKEHKQGKRLSLFDFTEMRIVEVSLEEWERLTPEERRERHIAVVHMPDGLRLPIYDFKFIRITSETGSPNDMPAIND